MSPEWEDAPNLSRLLGGLEEAMGWHEPAKVCANCRWVRQAKESDTMPYWGVYCADPK